MNHRSVFEPTNVDVMNALVSIQDESTPNQYSKEDLMALLQQFGKNKSVGFALCHCKPLLYLQVKECRKKNLMEILKNCYNILHMMEICQQTFLGRNFCRYSIFSRKLKKFEQNCQTFYYLRIFWV